MMENFVDREVCSFIICACQPRRVSSSASTYARNRKHNEPEIDREVRDNHADLHWKIDAAVVDPGRLPHGREVCAALEPPEQDEEQCPYHYDGYRDQAGNVKPSSPTGDTENASVEQDTAELGEAQRDHDHVGLGQLVLGWVSDSYCMVEAD